MDPVFKFPIIGELIFYYLVVVVSIAACGFIAMVSHNIFTYFNWLYKRYRHYVGFVQGIESSPYYINGVDYSFDLATIVNFVVGSSFVWPFFIYKNIKFLTINLGKYFIDKKNLAFLATHPSSYMRERAKFIKLNGIRSIFIKPCECRYCTASRYSQQAATYLSNKVDSSGISLVKKTIEQCEKIVPITDSYTSASEYNQILNKLNSVRKSVNPF